VFTPGFQTKGFIEGGDRPGLSEGHPHVITDQGEVLGGNIAELGLNVLKEVD
jgi:hypothetical protein